MLPVLCCRSWRCLHLSSSRATRATEYLPLVWVLLVLNNLAPFYCQPRRKLAIFVHPLLGSPCPLYTRFPPFVFALTLLVGVQFYCWHFVDCCLFSIKRSPVGAKPILKHITPEQQVLEYFIYYFLPCIYMPPYSRSRALQQANIMVPY